MHNEKMKNEGLKALSEYSHGILSFPCCLSLQQKQETPHAMTIMRMTETHPTMSSSFKLIWQFRPANQGLHDLDRQGFYRNLVNRQTVIEANPVFNFEEKETLQQP